MRPIQQGGQGSGGQPRTPGRNFLSSDPERQREFDSAGPRAGERRESVHAIHARPPRSPAEASRATPPTRRPAPQTDSDDEGGSSRRSL